MEIASSSSNYLNPKNYDEIEKIDNNELKISTNYSKKRIFNNDFGLKQNFLLRRLLWMFFILLILCLKTTLGQQFTTNERSLITGLLLKRFGLEELNEPIQKRLKNRRKLPIYIQNLYESVELGEHDSIRHYVPIKVQLLNSNEWFLSYNLTTMSQETSSEWIYRADLRFPFQKIRSALNQSIQRINLYKNKQLIKSKIIKKTSKWIDFDVSNSVQEAQSQTVNFVVKFNSSIKPNKQRKILKELKNKTALIVYVEELKNANKRIKKRVKREIIKSHQKRHRKHRKHNPKDLTQCRRTEMYVDFAELNWQDWIMAPVGYEAYQCRGRCPHPIPSQMNTTNHAIIQSLINAIDPSSVPPPSCVPVEMSALSILYKDINNVVVIKTYPDMRVEACGCH